MWAQLLETLLNASVTLVPFFYGIHWFWFRVTISLSLKCSLRNVSMLGLYDRFGSGSTLMFLWQWLREGFHEQPNMLELEVSEKKTRGMFEEYLMFCLISRKEVPISNMMSFTNVCHVNKEYFPTWKMPASVLNDWDSNFSDISLALKVRKKWKKIWLEWLLLWTSFLYMYIICHFPNNK